MVGGLMSLCILKFCSREGTKSCSNKKLLHEPYEGSSDNLPARNFSCSSGYLEIVDEPNILVKF